MGRRSTAKEVAEAAGVSKWTVIRAFTPGASIAEASREKVMEAARRLNYSPNLLARSLATNLTRQVAAFVDDFANPHKLPFLATLTEILQSEGLVVTLININRHFDHVHALLNADQRQVDAVVLCGTAFRDETLQDKRLGPGTPPTFVLARDSQIDGVPAITCDVETAMAEICDYLAAKPYRRPGFMSGPQTLSTALGRQRLFSDFWRNRGVPAIPDIPAADYSIGAGAAAMRAYLAATPADRRLDLLMCENDVLAFGAMDVIRGDFHLRVPEDIAVAGFDNTTFAASPAYDLTSYEQPIEAMVRTVADMILDRAEKRTVYLKGRLVPRRSA
ncbi:Transcriptional regulator protein [uncultured Pleomorphomonas sp.]|uniref:Transcriptional regulator protein n=1 Tax=uncultured Pleomorphomonas sp. TaxID=442121 RepID=A0A212LE05_9HYPH|nr:LacI family DNA-binding transcriptional regulator [uncultured Pleomorphomonas sp.]SCM75814.1 Transcriptional regulator protein [uncultured Pleomorphomonas sp.]